MPDNRKVSPDRAAAARHAWPFQMIDRVAARQDEICTVVKLLSADETLARAEPGADPGRMPSFLLIEALVQAALPLAAAAPRGPASGNAGNGGDAAGAGAAANGAGTGMLVAIHSARILRSANPGDVLTITAAVTARLGAMIRVASRAVLRGENGAVAEGEFTIATGADGAPATCKGETAE
jgi:3-hydroxymyristoyl/3-hydroxydecanoyl-(acyl carrier protein) dehydratase